MHETFSIKHEQPRLFSKPFLFYLNNTQELFVTLKYVKQISPSEYAAREKCQEINCLPYVKFRKSF